MAPRPVVPAALMSGPFTVAEAARVGVSWDQLQGATWTRVSTGFYVLSSLATDPTSLLVAVRRRLPRAAVFAGRTAGWLHGLDLPPCEPVEVIVPRATGVAARAGIRVHRSLTLEGRDVVIRRGLRTTTIRRTLSDLATRLPVVEVVVLVDAAVRRGLVSLQELSALPRLARAVDLAAPASESPMETRLRVGLVLAGLPRPEVQVELRDRSREFIARVDLYYPSHRLAIEYDGSNHRDRLVEDNRRQNAILRAGYTLLRFTAPDVLRTPDATVAQVRAALT
jgi:hypothetical protein